MGDVFNDQPFLEALAYFKAKGIEISPDSWRDVWQAANTRAFTVARVTSLDVLADIQGEVRKALDQGTSLSQFRKDLIPMLQRKGWWAPYGEKAIIKLPDGTVRKRLTPWRLDTIYRTNLQSAYQAGRYKQQMATAQMRPYWQYHAILDRKTRMSHAAQDGKIYDYRHPFWSTWYPPNGFNCRCFVTTLSAADMKKKGLSAEERGSAFQPDEGWRYNVGESGMESLAPDLANMPANARQRYLEEQLNHTCPDDWRDFAEGGCFGRLKKKLNQPDLEAMQALVWARSEGEIEGFKEWVSGVIEKGIETGELYPVGNLPDKALFGLGPARQPRLALVTMDDRAILHLLRQVKDARGAALTAEEIKSIPERFADSDWWIDREDPALLLTWVREGEIWIKVVIRLDQKVGRGFANRIVSAGVVKDYNVTEDGRYEKL